MEDKKYQKNYTKAQLAAREDYLAMENKMVASEGSQICELLKHIPKEDKPKIIRECFALRR